MHQIRCKRALCRARSDRMGLLQVSSAPRWIIITRAGLGSRYAAPGSCQSGLELAAARGRHVQDGFRSTSGPQRLTLKVMLSPGGHESSTWPGLQWVRLLCALGPRTEQLPEVMVTLRALRPLGLHRAPWAPWARKTSKDHCVLMVIGIPDRSHSVCSRTHHISSASGTSHSLQPCRKSKCGSEQTQLACLFPRLV